MIKSMGCFEKFRKFSIWWTLRFSNLYKGKLRKLDLKIFTWSKKVWLYSQITAFLIFWGEYASLTTVFSGISWKKSEVFVIIGKKISWIFKNSSYFCLYSTPDALYSRQMLINKCPYQCIYSDSRSKVKIFKCNYLSIAGTKLGKLSAHQIDNFLNFSKHPKLLFLVSLWRRL